jgi:iron complex outermembrane receptor protein
VDQQATFKIKSFGMGTQVSNQLNSAWAYQWMNSFQLNSIENPTIRNYEIRNEPNFSSRGVFHYKGAILLDAGYEYQIGQFDSQTYGNKKGVKDTLQVSQKTQIQQSTAFLQTEYTSLKNWTFTLSGSLNSYFTQQIFQELIFSPRLAILRKLSPFQSISAKISQGYSPPSISEMRPSTGIINTDLKAEKGWNKEISWRGNLTNKKLSWDLSVYQFDLSETIVVRRAADGSDYFANVGKTTQQGLEQNFRFSDYTTSGKTYSGNFLTGTSPFQNTLMAIYTNPNGFSWTGQYQFMDYMFLNDANTDVLPASRLLHSKISYTHRLANLTYEIWATAENILNETYSSGPDFNASPGRNYSLGIKIWVP